MQRILGFTSFSETMCLASEWRETMNAVINGSPRPAWVHVLEQVPHVGHDVAATRHFGLGLATFLWEGENA
jgi:hypothetical protein